MQQLVRKAYVITRRGFLKLGLGAALGVVAPLTYAWRENEPEHGPFIEDRGDYYRVLAPEGAVLRLEDFDKPVFAVVQDNVVVHNIQVRGFLYIVAMGLVRLSGVCADCRGMAFAGRIPAVLTVRAGSPDARFAMLGVRTESNGPLAGVYLQGWDVAGARLLGGAE